MGNDFTVINQTDEDRDREKSRINRIIRLNRMWERQYRDSIIQAAERNRDMRVSDYPQGDLMKIALCGIKYICSWRDVVRENRRLGVEYMPSLQESQTVFHLIDSIFCICGCLTLRNFMTTFPVDKEYDGERWGEKDYFYTMDVLKKMDLDKPIGRNELSELLWDYMNADLRHAYIEFTDAMSEIYRAQTGKGIAETWCEENGIPTYTADRETGIMRDSKTGEVIRMKKASHIRVVK